MAPSHVVAAFVAALAPQAVGAITGPKHARESLVAVEMHMFASDCGQVSEYQSKTLAKMFPGAGMDPKAVTPFLKVLKDGYYEVDCVKDMMYHSGDKFGNNKFEYDEGKAAGVSIVHYDDHVAKEDREPMTHKVCFNFCRTIQNMTFFGMHNGDRCYCQPYYEAIAGDSSQCDVPCPGNPTTMCGGMSKSSVFAMHRCANAQEKLSQAQTKLTNMKTDLDQVKDAVSQASDSMQQSATMYQSMFGAAGDPVASDLMQSAKVFAGELKEAAKRGDALSQAAQGMLQNQNFGGLTTSKEVAAAEKSMADMEQAVANGLALIEELETLEQQATPDLEHTEKAADKYYNMMYFVDKAFEELPATCGGDAAEKPILGSLDVCARACDEDVHECVGFSFMPGNGQSSPICFLLSKVKTAVYYTGCPTSPPAFLSAKSTTQPLCRLKLSKFEGAALKPDASGKCEGCLKELTKADRCYK